ncbi:hypothetical protein BHE74_00043330, partial [Ensete ventricosum]
EATSPRSVSSRGETLRSVSPRERPAGGDRAQATRERLRQAGEDGASEVEIANLGSNHFVLLY